MALDPEKELYILAIYDDFSKYSAPKGFFLNQCFSFFFLHDFKYIKNIFWGKMLVPIYIQPISCNNEFGYVPISQKPDLKFIIKLLHNFSLLFSR